MADMDMSDVFSSENMTPFTVRRRAQAVNNFGEAVETPKDMQAWGVLTIGSENHLEIGDAQQHQPKTLSIVTKFPLRGPSKGNTWREAPAFAPDLIVFKGSVYEVTQIGDYMHFGPGWIQAEASSTTFVDPAPVQRGI